MEPLTKIELEFPRLLGIPLSEIARQLSCTNETLLNNIKRDPKHRLHLKAYRIGPREYRVTWQHLEEWISRNMVGVEIRWHEEAPREHAA